MLGLDIIAVSLGEEAECSAWLLYLAERIIAALLALEVAVEVFALAVANSSPDSFKVEAVGFADGTDDFADKFVLGFSAFELSSEGHIGLDWSWFVALSWYWY